MDNQIQKGNQYDGGQQQNLWQSILNDVAQRDDVKDSNMIILGDRGAGKRSII